MKDERFDEFCTHELEAELRARRRAVKGLEPMWKRVLLWAPRKAQQWWNWLTVEGLKKFALLCTAMLLMVAVVTPIQNALVLRKLDASTQVIRCNFQRDNQVLLDQLRELGVPPEGSIVVLSAECVSGGQDGN